MCMCVFIYIIYIYIYIYIIRYGVYGSMGQPKANNLEVPDSTPGSYCFSLVFIKKLVNDKSIDFKTQDKKSYYSTHIFV